MKTTEHTEYTETIKTTEFCNGQLDPEHLASCEMFVP